MKNADMPAMPIPDDAESGGSLPLIALDKTGANGLTKREHFAGLAMQGMAGWCVRNCVDDENVAEWAIRMADAVLAELERTK